ncbi:MAG: hypothetical protein EBY25_12125 [Betaproteobacteria bacterium]|nr:hypothetical protein [Betaproteobacteria bacterium]
MGQSMTKRRGWPQPWHWSWGASSKAASNPVVLTFSGFNGPRLAGRASSLAADGFEEGGLQPA